MQPLQMAQPGVLTSQELKELSASPGPCITIFRNLHREDTRHEAISFKQAVAQVERKLEQRGIDADARAKLTSPLRDLDESFETKHNEQGICILRSNDVLKYYWLPRAEPESVEVGEYFCILPLIPLLTETRPFYILALSQKHIRLLRCTNTTSDEVPLPGDMPRSLDDFLQTDRPDHVLDNASAGGPGTGSMGRVMFGTSTDKERKDKFLHNFYRTVDRYVTELLKDETAPMVIAGVEYELPIFRAVSTFPRLTEDSVKGAPDGLKGGELHARALDAVRAYLQKDVAAALAMFEELGGSERTSVSIKEIVKAAYDGRVLHLFTAQGAHEFGTFDEPTHEVRTHRTPDNGDEDLLNAAAVQTLRHAGDVFVIPRNKIPHGSQMAAVMRY